VAVNRIELWGEGLDSGKDKGKSGAGMADVTTGVSILELGNTRASRVLNRFWTGVPTWKLLQATNKTGNRNRVTIPVVFLMRKRNIGSIES
jgi:hypothetical protein